MFASLLITFALLAAPGDVPQFRGPSGDGHAPGVKGLPLSWSETSNVAWKTELPGRGWSSPVVRGQRIWLTAAEETALPDEERKKKIAAAKQGEPLQTHASVTLIALEVDLASGKLLRRIELANVDDPPAIHATNSYATPTPVLVGERLVCDFGSLGTFGVDIASGKIIWKQRFAIDTITGDASSPVPWRDRVILTRDGGDAQYLVALEASTGDEIWRAARPPIDAKDTVMHRAFSTPLLVTHEGNEELISVGAQWIVAYDPANGKERWRINFGDRFSAVPRPVAGLGHIYFATGFMTQELWAVRSGGAGDVTESHVAWKHARQAPDLSSPILIGGELFTISSRGVAKCLDAQDGEELWQERLEGTHSASPLFADGKLFFLNEEGRCFVLNPGRKFEELARNQLFGHFRASPVAVGERLLLRSEGHLYCVGK